MNEKENQSPSFLNWDLNKIITVLGIIILMFGTYKIGYGYYHFYYYSTKTTGVVKGISTDTRGNKHIEFEFTLDGNIYKGSSRVNYNVVPDIGAHYKVVYSYKDYNVNKMIAPE